MAIQSPIVTGGLPQALSNLGGTLGSALLERQRRGKISDLLPLAQQGDEAAIAQLSQLDPNIANTLFRARTAGQQEQLFMQEQFDITARQYAPIADQALQIAQQSGVQASRDFLQQQSDATDNPLVKIAALSTINMPDDQAFMNDLRIDVSELRQAGERKFIGTPQRISKEVELPTGETVTQNFLTGLVQQPDGSIAAEEFPVTGEFVSPIGETAAQQRERKITTAGQTAAIKAAVKQGEKAFEQLRPVEEAVNLYDEAINLVQNEGANTGVIDSRLPSIKGASVKLDNLQSRLGLNVIQNTTFGALSENELKFALQAGLPTKLEGNDLVEWLQAKKASQQKLANYINEAATFLTSGENTIADFLELKKAQQINREEPAPAPTAAPGAPPVPTAAPVTAPAPEAAQPKIQEGATATNPQTNERVIFRNGQWEPF